MCPGGPGVARGLSCPGDPWGLGQASLLEVTPWMDGVLVAHSVLEKGKESWKL